MKGTARSDLDDFLVGKLRMDKSFIEELGPVEIRRNLDPRSKVKDEVIVRFDCKEDAVKAQGPNLANFRDEAGMRLHLPNHLQKDFKVFRSLSYMLKKKHTDLRRNVKFDKNDHGLCMDLQTERDGKWRRVKPEQARLATSKMGGSVGGPEALEEDEISQMLNAE